MREEATAINNLYRSINYGQTSSLVQCTRNEEGPMIAG